LAGFVQNSREKTFIFQWGKNRRAANSPTFIRPVRGISKACRRQNLDSFFFWQGVGQRRRETAVEFNSYHDFLISESTFA
jgi:hypothetical protein